ncbi:hypothetical protein CIRG_03079 [Coccidioides immitis RMSCC 2394]|uniref:Uncharacterized protein n=1 Tax=Coccidioides immitis RMSCC 2394 TaxID=404692 RepID=A0A0J6Y3Z9_COCIT|nr:hypothetical protein CIRG_03079 [Coccidioides immitis RMSCC 2394]
MAHPARRQRTSNSRGTRRKRRILRGEKGREETCCTDQPINGSAHKALREDERRRGKRRVFCDSDLCDRWRGLNPALQTQAGEGGARRRRDGLDEWRKEEWLACRLASRNVEFLLRLIGMARAQIQRNRANGVASGRGTRYLIPLRGHRLFHSPTSPSGSWTANAPPCTVDFLAQRPQRTACQPFAVTQKQLLSLFGL